MRLRRLSLLLLLPLCWQLRRRFRRHLLRRRLRQLLPQRHLPWFRSRLRFRQHHHLLRVFRQLRRRPSQPGQVVQLRPRRPFPEREA